MFQQKNRPLYEEDYLLWLQQTVKQLQARDIEHLDWANLIEEIESLGREQKHKVDSYLRQLVIHLLLHQYWSKERPSSGRGWQVEIENFRYELELLLESKTLYNYFLQRLTIVYPKARQQAILKSGKSPSTFPESCPYTPEDILKLGYFPKN